MSDGETDVGPMPRYGVRMPAELWQRIQLHAVDQHRNTSAQIRLAIEQHLENEGAA